MFESLLKLGAVIFEVAVQVVAAGLIIYVLAALLTPTEKGGLGGSRRG